jgi:hypothetical protein
MKYHKKRLGRLQQRILKYIITHDDHGFMQISDLWSSFQLRQPTISKSVQSLVNYGYLKHGGYLEHAWSLHLTDKGVAAAIMVGASCSELKKYVNRHYLYHPNPIVTRKIYRRGSRAILFIRKIVNAYQNKQDFVMKQAVEYALENNYFEDGNFRVLTKEEAQIFKLYIALKYIDEMGEWPTLREFVSKYGIDKGFLRKRLEKQRQYVDSIIQELA